MDQLQAKIILHQIKFLLLNLLLVMLTAIHVPIICLLLQLMTSSLMELVLTLSMEVH